jgi:hypothetical protein
VNSTDSHIVFDFSRKSNQCRKEVEVEMGGGGGGGRSTGTSRIEERFEISGFLSGRQASGRMT